MNEGKLHLIISIVLGAVLVVLIGIGVYAIQKGPGRTSSPVSSASPSSAESGAGSQSESSETENSETESSQRESSREAVSEKVSSASGNPESKTESSRPASSEASSKAESAESAPPFVDASGATAVNLFAGGKVASLTPEQITEFMRLFKKVTMQYVRSEDNTDLIAQSDGGFSITYQDGKTVRFYIGAPYDGTWWSGNDFYELSASAMELEEYMAKFSVISDWLNRSANAGVQGAS